MADDQKIENLLNLALGATAEERRKSPELMIGYDEEDQRWDIIVKYNGNILRLEDEEVRITELSNEYAIMNLPESRIDEIAAQPEIEYVEKPKRLVFSVNQGRAASCINVLQTAQYNLRGQGIIVAVLDSGVDYAHPDFRREDGTTRILALWDQTASGTPPEGFRIGAEFTREQINAALEAPTTQERYRLVPSRDINGHGTGVLGIAAGNGRASEGQYRGVASESDILVVKLGLPRPNSFPRTTEMMQAVDYVIRKAREFRKPVAINLSFGTVYGGHDGSSLLETYLDDMANIWKTTILAGTGNEGAAAGHTSGRLINGEVQEAQIGVAPGELSFNIQLWKSYVDEMEIYLVHPSGERVGPLQETLGSQRYQMGETEILIYYGKPGPYSTSQEIYFDFIPKREYLDSGIWRVRLVPRKIVDGNFDMWLPSEGSLNLGSRFYQPTPDTTLTLPSSSRKLISVGAYDSRLMTYAPFSGRGYTRGEHFVKPDLAAPGVGIMTTVPGGGYQPMTGTSFAVPFATGAAAMLMQWGIVEGNDAFLYGEKVKAYLRRGARELPGFTEYPNPQVGYGALCVENSLPG
ncbi:S8 family peptidase [Hominisplanchenecus murintestinalis]|uniref:S8 family peptidase n=1 Tax=Hominisplanchenecus murintestinalis TaxID=2941517 RepID=UPI00203D16A3|nr:S8 family peptidase [Hominisplanchenecus murintestinalis]